MKRQYKSSKPSMENQDQIQCINQSIISCGNLGGYKQRCWKYSDDYYYYGYECSDNYHYYGGLADDDCTLINSF